ncbi:MAG: glycosyltransferase family 39 protein [Candidatus Omnitrophica bacterium]|nr:glycosyltransferase family 39 protein [Candidatus Omnitrophota bacterium]
MKIIKNEISKRCFQKCISFYNSKIFIIAIILYGIILRLRCYLFNRSLWLDEAMLSLNIVNRDFLGLLKPLEYSQGAPIGFLWVERIMVLLFGNNELTLRLFPLMAGILSIFLFYILIKYYIDSKFIQMSLLLFVVSEKLIYYSSEVKQYAVDVLVTLILYIVFVRLQFRKITVCNAFFLGIIGAISIWFSHASFFVLSGIGLIFLLFYLYKKDRSSILSLCIVFLFWIFSFLTNYFLVLVYLKNNSILLGYWDDYFMPFPPRSFWDLVWFEEKFCAIFSDPMGLTFTGIAILTFLVGCVDMFANKRKEYFLLSAPIFITLAASAFRLYPFGGRLILFLVPIILIFISQGARKIITQHSGKSISIGIIVTSLLIFDPTLWSSYYMMRPKGKEEIKPVLEYVSKHIEKNHYIYVYYYAEEAFNYYLKDYKFDKSKIILANIPSNGKGEESWSECVEDLNSLKGYGKIWFIFSHDWKSEDKLFISVLDSMGKRMDSFQDQGASAYLYDISEFNY